MSMRSEFENDFAGRPTSGRELDLAGLGRTIAARRWWILVPTLLCFIGSVIFVSVVQPRYTAEAKVLVENGENAFTRSDKTDQIVTILPDDEAVQSQIQLVQSRDIARQAIRRLELKGNEDFDPLARGLGALSRIGIMLGLERDPALVSPEDRILANYFDRLTVYSVPKSRVIAIQFTAADPDLAARAANTIAELVIEAQSAAKRESASTAAASLGSLVTDLRSRVSEAEAKADRYRTETGLLLGTNNTTITTQQLGDMNTQLAQARTAQADAQAKAKLIKDMIRQNRVGEIPDVANNDFMRRISEQRSTLRAEIALQARTLLPGHPHMQELNAQLADVDSQLRSAGEKLARTLENEGRIAAGRVENLLAAMDVQKRTVGTAGGDQVRLNALETQARLLKDQLEFNTAKYQQALARETVASTPADARVISRAAAPQLPSFPKKVPIVAIMTIAGLVFSLGWIVARELLSGNAFGTAVPMAVTPIRARGTTAPLAEPVTARSATEVAADGAASLLETLDALRLRPSPGRAVRALVIPPSVRAESPDAVMTLARRVAEERRTILVDFNRRGPAVRSGDLARDSFMATDGEPLGLTELLAGRANFAEIIHRDNRTRLHVVPVGQLGLDDEALDPVGLVLDALGETYDCVLLHAPAPTDPLTLRLTAAVDTVVMVHDGQYGTIDVEAARAALIRNGTVAGGGAPIHVVPASVLMQRPAVREAA